MSNDLYTLAPQGCIYVCSACGKTSPTRAGFDPDTGRNFPEAKGWDESCMMNAVLCKSEKDADGDWVAVPKEVP